MGYTHYWRHPRWSKADRTGFVQALPIIRDILHVRHKGILCRSFGSNGLPTVNDREIQFNGLDGGEDFLCFNRPRRGDYCKTGWLPYDTPVCEVLLVLHAHCLNFEIKSDGLSKKAGQFVLKEESWYEAHENVRHHYSGLNLRCFRTF